MTNRQNEALAQMLLKLPLSHRLDGSKQYGGSSAKAALRNRLMESDLIDRRFKLSHKGLDALEAGRLRLPDVDAAVHGIPLDALLRGAIVARRAELAAEARADEELLAKRKAAREALVLERRRAIPIRFRELLAEHNLREPLFDSPDPRVLDDVLVELWNAIAHADVAI